MTRLEGFTFGDPFKVMTAVTAILSKILLDEFVSVLDEWKYRLLECTDRGGEYVLTD
jgi:hypothetical protein